MIERSLCCPPSHLSLTQPLTHINKHIQFNITKLQWLEAEKAKVRREYERKESTTEVKKKVEYSKQLNESRLKILQAQDDAVRAMQGDAQSKLGALSKKPSIYTDLLKGLLSESLYKLGESNAKVRCRKSDAGLVQSIIPQVTAEFPEKFGGRAAPTVEVDVDHPLPEGGSGAGAGDEFDTCAGGLVVTSWDGRIVCSNTLDQRLEIAYSKNLPAVRELLFGAAV